MIRKKDFSQNKSIAPSKSVQMNEILKCGSDASYFIKHYVKISHPMKGLLKFDTFPYQDKCLKDFQENRFVIVNKSRQLGLSTLAAAYALWMVLFQKEKTILIMATKFETAKLFIRKVESMLASLPTWLVMPKIKAQSVKNIEFSNGSQVKAIPTSPDAGRGDAVSLLIVDEAAHVENIEEVWLGLWPTLSTGGSAILISSPSGVGSFFHKIWEGGKNETNDFFNIELPWTVHPERDQEWFEETKKGIIEAKGERGVGMELLCSFASSGDTFLRADVMDRLFESIKEPKHYWGPAWTAKKDLWIWEITKTDHKYIIGADVARGDGEDFSTLHVIDMDADEVVAEYKGKVPPDLFGEILATVGHMYNTALICPEKNTVGTSACLKLKELNYPNLYYEKFQKNIYMAYTTADVKDELPGIETTQKNRLEFLSKLEDTLRNKKVKTYSRRLYEEFQTFVWKKDKPQAQKGYNDDLVLALSICNSLYEAGGKTSYQTDDFAKAMLIGMSKSTTTSTGQQSSNFAREEPLPPIMTGGTLSEFLNRTKINTMKANGTQDHNDPFWKNFAWVIKD